MSAAVALWAGGVGAILATFLALVRIAVGTERRRADDWRETARTTTAANEVLAANDQQLISAIGELAASQREVLSLLHKLADREEAPG